MACNVGAVLYAVLQFIAFILVLVATPLDMFRLRGESRFGNTLCLTLWGGKENCNTVMSDTSYVELWSICLERFARFRLAEVFAVISIFVYGSAALLGFIVVFCCTCLRWVCLALNITGAVTVCVVWGLMVFDYQHADGLCPAINTHFNIGNGLALMLAASILDIINIVFLLIPCQPMDPSKENTQW